VRTVRLTGPARRDIASILRWTEDRFGADARTRYRMLIDAAIRELAENPDRPGVRSIADVRPGYWIYPLRFSRRQERRTLVARPRHLLAFCRYDDEVLVIARLFHERQVLERHLGRAPSEDGRR
jgi:toxin ParE1/3/4